LKGEGSSPSGSAFGGARPNWLNSTGGMSYDRPSTAAGREKALDDAKQDLKSE